MSAAGGYREVLQVRDARRLIAASAASQLGNWLYNAALLSYVFASTRSAVWVGVATVFRLTPYVVLGPIGGVVADRYDRRLALLAGDLIRTAVMVVLAFVVAAGGPVVMVIALTAVASAAGTAERPASMAMLPHLVGENRLGTANALLHTVQDLGIVAGPAVGALLLAVGPPEWAFVANALTFGVSALFTARLGPAPPPSAAKLTASLLGQLRHGFRTVAGTPYVILLFAVVAMAEMTYGAQTVQLVVYARRELGLSSSGYGCLLSMAGLGGVLSVAVNPRLAASARVSRAVVATGGLCCATGLAYAGMQVVALALVVALVGGAGLVACEVVVDTTIARIVPADALGRVMGVYDAVSVAAMVLGAVLAPVLLAATSLAATFVALSAGTLVVTLGTRAGLRGLDALSRARAEAVAAQVATLERLPIAANVPALVLERLAASAQTCTIPAGVDVVVQGAPAHAFYAIVDGTVIVHRDGQEVTSLGPGDFFGERGLLDRAPRNASVTTATVSTLLRLEGEVLMAALQMVPALLSALDRPVMGSRMALAGATAMVDDPTWAPS